MTSNLDILRDSITMGLEMTVDPKSKEQKLGVANAVDEFISTLEYLGLETYPNNKITMMYPEFAAEDKTQDYKNTLLEFNK